MEERAAASVTLCWQLTVQRCKCSAVMSEHRSVSAAKAPVCSVGLEHRRAAVGKTLQQMARPRLRADQSRCIIEYYN